MESLQQTGFVDWLELKLSMASTLVRLLLEGTWPWNQVEFQCSFIKLANFFGI